MVEEHLAEDDESNPSTLLQSRLEAMDASTKEQFTSMKAELKVLEHSVKAVNHKIDDRRSLDGQVLTILGILGLFVLIWLVIWLNASTVGSTRSMTAFWT